MDHHDKDLHQTEVNALSGEAESLYCSYNEELDFKPEQLLRNQPSEHNTWPVLNKHLRADTQSHLTCDTKFSFSFPA